LVSFTSQPLYLRERAPGTHWIGGWVGPRAGLNVMVKRKIPSPTTQRESNPRTPIVQPTTTPIIIIITTTTIIIIIIITTLHLDPNIYILLQKTVVINTTTTVRRFLNN
jgi:hypothetical protein